MSLRNFRRSKVAPPPAKYDPEWANQLRRALDELGVDPSVNSPLGLTHDYFPYRLHLVGNLDGLDLSDGTLDGRVLTVGDASGTYGVDYRQLTSPTGSLSVAVTATQLQIEQNPAYVASLTAWEPLGETIVTGDLLTLYDASHAALYKLDARGFMDLILAEVPSPYYQYVRDSGGTLLTQRDVLGITSPLKASDASPNTSIKLAATVADKYLYSTAADTWAEGTITAFGRSLADDINATAALTTLGAVGGTSLGVYEIVYGTGPNYVDSSSIFTIDLTPASLSLDGHFYVTNTQTANQGITSLTIAGSHSGPTDGPRGISNSVSITGTSVITGISRGISTALSINKTGGSFNDAVAAEYTVTVRGSVGTGAVYGLFGGFELGDSVTVTNLYGNYTDDIYFTGVGASVTNSHGWYIGDQGHAQVGTAKCIAISTQTNSATKTWVFAVDATQDSYFAGQFGIGMTTAPAEQVEIRDASGVQLRLSTSDTVYSNFQNSATTGVLTITTVGTTPNINLGTSTAFTFNTATENLGIGQAASSTARVGITYSPTTNSAWRGLTVALSPAYATGGAINTNPVAISGTLTITGTDAATGSTGSGLSITATSSKASGTLGTLRGCAFAAVSSGGGNVTNLFGCRGAIQITGGGNSTTVATFYAQAPTLSSGVATTLSGLLIENHGHGTRVTTAKCIAIDTQTNSATKTWVIASDATQDSYLAGALSLGMTSAPARVLEVRSTSAQIRASYDSTHEWEFGVDSAGEGKFATDTNGRSIEIEATRTITGAVTDGYAGSLLLDPGYTAATAQTVTRHNYLDVQNVSVAGAGPAAVTDACLVRFDAAAGTHKAVASGTTKTTPGTVDAWIKININGTLYYVPAYTSTTA